MLRLWRTGAHGPQQFVADVADIRCIVEEEAPAGCEPNASGRKTKDIDTAAVWPCRRGRRILAVGGNEHGGRSRRAARAAGAAERECAERVKHDGQCRRSCTALDASLARGIMDHTTRTNRHKAQRSTTSGPQHAHMRSHRHAHARLDTHARTHAHVQRTINAGKHTPPNARKRTHERTHTCSRTAQHTCSRTAQHTRTHSSMRGHARIPNTRTDTITLARVRSRTLHA